MLHIKKGYNLVYWTKTDDGDMVNLGDYIGKILFDIAKIKSTPYGKPAFVTGSLLDDYWRKQYNNPILVWGTGSTGQNFPHLQPKDEILAVRGPLTRTWLQLPDNIPLGDPALLLPRVFQPKKINLGPIKIFNYPNHHHGLSMRVNKWHWQGIVQTIASAEIVLANTLHAAILAQAYNTPWALYQFNHNPFPQRWYDWFEYLNLPKNAFQSVSNTQDAQNWWNQWHKYIQMPHLQPLIDSCPWSQIRKIIS